MLQFITLLTFLTTASAQKNECTLWSKVPNTYCFFAGQKSLLWERECTHPCRWRNFGAHCDEVQICLNQNPNNLQTLCTDWVMDPNLTCINSESGRLEPQWVRSCTVGLATTWCSWTKPN